ncbi:MAG: Uma2 family endonuclease [Bacteroidota bacterium]
MSVLIDRYLFTVDEYHKMVEGGVLHEDSRVELINGEIITMSPINSPHGGHVKRINAFFSAILGKKAILSVQDPLHIPEHSEPEPDVMLLKPRDDFYANAHPEPQDVYLLIEVADSSLDFDRKVKLPLYAEAQVSEVWIVNLADKQIEVHRSSAEGEYQQTEIVKRDQAITIPHFLISVAAEDLIG